MTGLCKSCKHMIYCTFNAECGARFCDEYEDSSSAEEHDWDLAELTRLFPPTQADAENS